MHIVFYFELLKVSDARIPCFMLFFNIPFQYAPLLNLCPLIFSWLPFGWLHSDMLTPYLSLYLLWEYHVLFTPTFQDHS